MITKQKLVDDLEARLTRANPSSDDKFTKTLLAHFLDLARDSYIATKLAKLHLVDGVIDPVYLYRDAGLSLTAAGVSSVAGSAGFTKTKHVATLTHNVLDISSLHKHDIGLVSGVLYTGGDKESILPYSNTDGAISRMYGGVFLVANPTDGEIYIYSNGGNRIETKTVAAISGNTVLDIQRFKDGVVWYVLKDPVTTNWKFGASVDNLSNIETINLSAGASISATAAKTANDGSKILIFAGDPTNEGGAACVRIFNGKLNSSNLYTLSATNFKDISDISTIEVHSVEILDKDNIYIGAANSQIYISNNGYDTTDAFRLVTIDSSNLGDVTYISFIDKLNGVAVIDGVGLYFTNDGGLSWAAIEADLDGVTSVKTRSPWDWVVVTSSSIKVTKDGGRTFSLVHGKSSTISDLGNIISIGENGVDFIYNNGNYLYVKNVSEGKQGIVGISSIDVQSLFIMKSMRFSKPSKEAPVMVRVSGSSDTIEIYGIEQYSSLALSADFIYVREGSSYALADDYGIALSDLDPVLQRAFELAFNAIIGNPHEDSVTDGNQSDNQKTHSN